LMALLRGFGVRSGKTMSTLPALPPHRHGDSAPLCDASAAGRTSPSKPHVIIVGAGFGGLSAAKAFAKEPVSVTVIDRRNHHLFQPLLYQVATAALSPAQIAAPIRAILRGQKNATVLLAEVAGIDSVKREVVLNSPDGQRISFDYLVIATGARHSYFGHDAWQHCAFGLKSLEDATDIRLHCPSTSPPDLEPHPDAGQSSGSGQSSG
jgi:NADH dehydrogenase